MWVHCLGLSFYKDFEMTHEEMAEAIKILHENNEVLNKDRLRAFELLENQRLKIDALSNFAKHQKNINDYYGRFLIILDKTGANAELTKSEYLHDLNNEFEGVFDLPKLKVVKNEKDDL